MANLKFKLNKVNEFIEASNLFLSKYPINVA